MLGGSLTRALDSVLTGAGHATMLLLLMFGQVTGVTRASSSRIAAHQTTTQRVFQRCPQRNRPSGTVTIGFVPEGTNNLFTAANFPILENLFVPDDTGRLRPQMATVAPTVKNGGILDGGKAIVIHLKRGLRWSNGTEITSADVRFGWQVARDPVSGGCPACGLVAGIGTPTRYTIVFHLKQRGGSLLYWFGEGAFGPWPVVWPHAWSHDAHQAAVKLNTDPTWTFIGPGYPTDGPYYIASSTDTQAVLLPMKYYTTMSCGAYLARIVVRAYPSDASLLAAAASHEVDLMPYLVDGLGILTELQRHRSAYTTHLEPSLLVENIPFNDNATYQGKPNPVHDARVRLALALALDKTRLTERALPLNSREAARLEVWSPWVRTPKLMEQYADRSINGQWDPLADGGKGAYVAQTGTGTALSDARKLLAQTPWKHGFSLDLYTTTNNGTRQIEAQEIAADWARIGVKVVSHFVSGGQLFASFQAGGILAHGSYQTAVYAQLWGAGGPADIDFLLDSKYIQSAGKTLPPVAQNIARIRDTVIDRSFVAAARTLRHTQLEALYASIQRQFARMGYLVMLYSHPIVWTDDGRIQDVTAGLVSGGLSLNAWTWKLKGR